MVIDVLLKLHIKDLVPKAWPFYTYTNLAQPSLESPRLKKTYSISFRIETSVNTKPFGSRKNVSQKYHKEF